MIVPGRWMTDSETLKGFYLCSVANFFILISGRSRPRHEGGRVESIRRGVKREQVVGSKLSYFSIYFVNSPFSLSSLCKASRASGVSKAESGIAIIWPVGNRIRVISFK